MDETDRFLLDTLGGPAAARVVVIPTASALELGMPERWNNMGVAHFRALGAQVTPVMLLTRDDAHDERVLADLRGADLYYFSGGNPEHVIETLRDTPAWQIIRAGYAAGRGAGRVQRRRDDARRLHAERARGDARPAAALAAGARHCARDRADAALRSRGRFRRRRRCFAPSWPRPRPTPRWSASTRTPRWYTSRPRAEQRWQVIGPADSLGVRWRRRADDLPGGRAQCRWSRCEF